MSYRWIRPLLFRLDAEAAHDRALSAAAYLASHPRLARAFRRIIARPAAAPVTLMGLQFPHRVGLAAGFDKNGVAPLAWWALGFAFVELGTVTPRPQPGHPKPRMFRFVQQRALVNRMGFNNDGAEAVEQRLAQQRTAGRRPNFPIGISVGKNAPTPLEQATDDFAAAAARLGPHADFISMNVSSPNTPGLRSLQTREALTRLVAAVRNAAAGKPVLVKVAPELDGADLEEVVDACRDAGAAGMIATNTLSTTGRSDMPEGGLSGRPLRDVSLQRVERIRNRIGADSVVIGCGGIDDTDSASAMLSAGADLVQVYSGLIFEGPLLAARLSRGLRRTRGA